MLSNPVVGSVFARINGVVLTSSACGLCLIAARRRRSHHPPCHPRQAPAHGHPPRLAPSPHRLAPPNRGHRPHQSASRHPHTRGECGRPSRFRRQREARQGPRRTPQPLPIVPLPLTIYACTYLPAVPHPLSIVTLLPPHPLPLGRSASTSSAGPTAATSTVTCLPSRAHLANWRSICGLSQTTPTDSSSPPSPPRAHNLALSG